MKLTGTVILIYGIITVIGVIIGYIKASSVLSFILSAVLGVVLVFCSMMIYKGNFTGVYISLVIAFGLGVFFGLKYTKFDNLMPDGILTIVSMFALGFSVYALSNKEAFKGKLKP